MTQFTIERLTQKEVADNKSKLSSPSASQRQTFLDAMSLLSSGQSFQWGETDSEGRSRPVSSGSEGNSPSSTTFGSTGSLLTSSTPSTSPVPPSPKKEEGTSSPNRQKPPHSYIALIAMAILNSPAKRLLLCDIYEYIMAKFPYFRNNERSWRNSIRHNLSLNECFIKAGRSDDGRGHFWAIHPANADDFSRGDFRRRRARRRVRAVSDYEVFTYPYPCYPPSYPSTLPSQMGCIPMTYSLLSTIFPSGITPYMTPRLPQHHPGMPTGYLPAVTNTVPSVSSPLTCLSSTYSPSSPSGLSPVACTSPSCSPPSYQSLQTPPSLRRSRPILSPFSRDQWSSLPRAYHPYNIQ
ncbi:Forkhead box protein B1 [Holothuria leucospilota]|uniref:Forkhead box protein B1 n=1 Tax=Holothuria leucospilota TaxID=206669 RepID=A0A9Q0YJK8_HOLLE|nr:Forkhead box protein B1 [Holothuria leucospilota]